MSSLQDILMESLRDVRAGTMSASNASSVNALAQTLINSAKVEIDFMRATKRTSSQFFSGAPQSERLTKSGGVVHQTEGGTWPGLTHRMQPDDEDENE